MGAVLEMTLFTKTVGSLALCLSLMSCGNDGQFDYYSGLFDGLKATLPGAQSKAQAAHAAALTPEALAQLKQLNQPIILATSDIGASPLIRVSQNRGYDQWHSAAKIGFTFKDGLLTATRGLGGDLMNADVEQSLARLRSGSSEPATRVHRYLDGENNIITLRFVCTFERKGQERIDIAGTVHTTIVSHETCNTSDLTLKNTYWTDPRDGFVWKSEQWISTFVGDLTFQRLIR